METNYIQIVTEQRQEIPEFLTIGWVEREQEPAININSKLVQVVTGVRRSGKSTLVHRALAGKPYAYANFDDERLAGISADRLNDLLEALYSVYGDFSYLFLDEIQNVENWHLFVNRLLRNSIHVVLAGSNSKLLSRELATHLTGRYSPVELYPYSFREYLNARKSTREIEPTAKSYGLLINQFNEYQQTGGLPEIVSGEPAEAYATNFLEAIITRDIIYRYGIRFVRTFREIAKYLISNFGKEISYNRIKNQFGLGSENTAKNYVGYLEEAWLVLTLPKFSFKNQETLRYRKIYSIDTAFCQIAGNRFSINSGRLLENIVFLELARNAKSEGYEVFFYKKNIEVDFLLYKDRQVIELIQVAETLTDPRTRKREIRALICASQELSASNLTIITLNEQSEIEESGFNIKVKRVTTWLLDKRKVRT